MHRNDNGGAGVVNLPGFVLLCFAVPYNLDKLNRPDYASVACSYRELSSIWNKDTGSLKDAFDPCRSQPLKGIIDEPSFRG